MAINRLHTIRRFLLRHLVPEFIWPKNVNLDGTVVRVRNTPYSFGTKMILKRGTYESAEREILKNILFPGAQVLEMGGSIGVLTAIISNRIGPTGKLISIEASKKLTSYSKQWLERLGNVVVETGYAFPVYEISSQLEVSSFDESAGSLGGVVKFEVNEKRNQADKDIFDIKSIIVNHDFKPEILVIDIEGSEGILLAMPLNLPTSIRKVLIELHPGLYENGEVDKKKIIESFIREGFAIAQVKHSSFLFEK